MSLELYFHPLSSFCMKALIALYENDTPFEKHLLDLQNPAVRDAYLKLSPLGKMPILQDHARNQVVLESTVVIEYLAAHYPGKARLVPEGGDLAWQTRMQDRFFDLYVMDPMQKIVIDKLRPEDKRDAHGVELAKGALKNAYQVIDTQMATRTWATGDAFTMADCAAAPALFYANKVVPIGEAHRHAAAYLGRLVERPSFARVLEEAQPYFAMFPG